MNSRTFTHWAADHPIQFAFAFFLLLAAVQSAIAPLQGAPAFPSLGDVILRSAPAAVFLGVMAKLFGPRWKKDFDS